MSCMPRIFSATPRASFAPPFTTFTPPPLPRPPAWICALTTTTGAPVSVMILVAACSASSTVKQGMPFGTAMPYFANSCLPWYSWIFIDSRLRFHDVDDLLHAVGAGLEHGLLLRRQLDVDDLLDAAGADDHRHAEVQVLVAVLTVEVGGGRQQSLLVQQVGFGHDDGAVGRRVERARAHQIDDFAAAFAGAVDHFGQLVGRDQLLDRHAVDRAVVEGRHHVVTVAAEHHGAHVFDAGAGLARQEQREASAVEHAGHADDLLARGAGAALELVDHRVERVADHDHEGVRTMFLGVVGDVLDDRQVDAHQVVARLARLARDAGGDDQHVGAGEIFPVRGAGDLRVSARAGGRLLEVKSLTFGEAFLGGDIEQHDVAQLLGEAQIRQLAADVARTNQTNLLSSHGFRLQR